MLGYIVEKLGGLTRDVVELGESIVEEAGSIPDRFSKGYDKGLIITPEPEQDNEQALSEINNEVSPIYRVESSKEESA